ncbi:MAG: AraC family transcriptional regulator [Clostridium sp.]|nr:AraC family transcriptional regulator [Clostridium sp.]
MGTIDFISKRLVTFNKKKEARGDKPSLYYQEIYNNRARMFCHTPYILEERLVNAVLSGDEEAAVLCLKEINRSGNKAVLASDSVRSAKNSVICTCVFLARAAIQAGVSPDEAFALSDANIRRIEEFTGKHAALKYEEDLLLQFVKLIKNNRGREFSIVVHRAVQYIDSHLSERLRLADIADYAEVSPQYLSGVFSKEMRMPITNYISMRKIQESTHFISQKKYSITDVALLYGFSSQSHYIQVFKKVMGTTPGKYRGLQAVM